MSEIDRRWICPRCGEVFGVTGACRCLAAGSLSTAESDIPQEFTEELARLSLELAKTRVAIERLITDQAFEIDRLRTALEKIRDEKIPNLSVCFMLREIADNALATK